MSTEDLIEHFRQTHPGMFAKPKHLTPQYEDQRERLGQNKTAAEMLQQMPFHMQQEMLSREREMEKQKMYYEQQAGLQNTAISNMHRGMGGNISNATSSAGGAGGGGTIGQLSQAYQQYSAAAQAAPPRFNPNDNPATKMPLSTLVDLWRAKFQDTWVDLKSHIPNDDDKFWVAGETRLERMGELEVMDGWARIREDA